MSASFVADQIVEPFKRWPFWLMYGWRDTIRPYGRTIFGPLAITFQTAVWVAFIYWVFKDSLGRQGEHYLIYLAYGYPAFIFFQSCVIGGQSLLRRNAGLIQNIDTPFLLFVLRYVTACWFILLFSHIVMAVTLYLDNAPIGLNLFTAAFWYLAGIPLAIAITTVAAFLGVFMPNVMVVVGAITRFLFFATPILWYIEVREGFRFWVATLNPIAHYINLVREPLLGNPVPLLSILVYFGSLILGSAVALIMLRYFKHKVILKL